MSELSENPRLRTALKGAFGSSGILLASAKVRYSMGIENYLGMKYTEYSFRISVEEKDTDL